MIMKLRIVVLFAFFVALIFSACQKEYFKTAQISSADTISFSKDLLPIMESKCAASGCHSGSAPPNLLTDKAYSALVDGGLVDTANPDKSVLMTRLNKDMPATKLSPGEIQKFQIWIKQGALEN